MKQKLFLILATCCLFGAVRAQIIIEPIKHGQWYYLPMPQQDSVEWMVAYSEGKSAIPKWQYYVFYKTKGDTLLGGHSYTKVYVNSKARQYLPTDTLVLFYRQDTAERQVFVRAAHTYYNDTNEYLMFDFNQNHMDTIMRPLFTRDGTFELRKCINSVDSQFFKQQRPDPIYGRMLLQVTTSIIWDTVNLNKNGKYYPSYDILEGIGSIDNTPFVYPVDRKRNIDLCHDKFDTVVSMHCMWIKDSLIITNYAGCSENCDKILKLEELKEPENNILMFPNPCREYISIDMGHVYRQVQVQVFNLNGQLLWQEQTGTQGVHILSTKEYSPGVYFIRLIDGQQLISSHKLIKQ